MRRVKLMGMVQERIQIMGEFLLLTTYTMTYFTNIYKKFY